MLVQELRNENGYWWKVPRVWDVLHIIPSIAMTGQTIIGYFRPHAAVKGSNGTCVMETELIAHGTACIHWPVGSCRGTQFVAQSTDNW